MRVRIPVALVAAAVAGTIVQSAWDDPAPAGHRLVEGWSAVTVPERSFPPGERHELAGRLYGWNCMPCHGPEGKGDGPVAARLGLRPRDFSRGMFQLKSSHRDEMPFDDDLYRSISTGFPNGAMPAFAEFTEDERWALVDHVKSLSGRRFEADPPKRRVPDAPVTGNPTRGARLFASCAPCHGPRGRGDGPATPVLVDADDRPAVLPDFTRGEMSFKGGSRPEDVYRTLSTGLSGTAMPSFLSLPEQDRRDLAEYVTTLYRPIRPGEKLFLAKGCTHCHTIGRGRRVGPDLAGVAGRRDRDWLRRWLENPQAMIATDPQAREMAREYPVSMPDLKLSRSEVGELLEFLVSPPPK